MSNNLRKRRIVGISLMVIGVLFLFVANDIFLGWGNVWPLFAVLVGIMFLKGYTGSRSAELLFGGITLTFLGVFLFLFTIGAVPWERMGIVWPVIPLIAGVSLLAVSASRRLGNASMIAGVGALLFAALGFLYNTGVVDERVASPFVRFWPLVLVVAGVVLLKTRGKETDPVMEAVREAMDEGTSKSHPSSSNGRSSEVDFREREIIANVKAAARGDAVKTLVSNLHDGFDTFSWVGVYRLTGGVLKLADGEFVGKTPEHTTIELSDGVCGAAATQKRTIIVPDVCKDERYLACSPTVKSEIVVPVVVRGDLKGVLDIDSDQLDAFGERDRDFLEGLLSQTAEYLFPEADSP